MLNVPRGPSKKYLETKYESAAGERKEGSLEKEQRREGVIHKKGDLLARKNRINVQWQ